MDSDAKRAEESLGLEPDEIITELDVPFRMLPVPAIRAAQECRDRIIPGLVQLIERDVQLIREGGKRERNGGFFAFFLLIEFRAAEALETILQVASLPDDLPLDLYGDAIHKALPHAVPAMADQRLDDILGMIRNIEVNQYVRWAFQKGLVHLFVAGLRSREEIVGHLRTILIEAIENKDYGAILASVRSLHDLFPEEAYDDIKRAYDLRFVDTFFICLGDVDRQLARGRNRVLRQLREEPAYIKDTVEMLRGWVAFRPKEPKPTVEKTQPTHSPQYLPTSDPKLTPIKRDDETRVGRNEPCPCGSGKKFKKCCGSAARRSD